MKEKWNFLMKKLKSRMGIKVMIQICVFIKNKKLKIIFFTQSKRKIPLIKLKLNPIINKMKLFRSKNNYQIIICKFYTVFLILDTKIVSRVSEI